MCFERVAFAPGDAEAWRQLTAALNAWLTVEAVPPGTCYAASLVLDEWRANLQLHARPQRPEGIEAAVGGQWSTSDGLTLELDDDAEPFDPTTLTDPPVATALDDLPIGGLGWRLIRRQCSAIAYRHADGRNRLSLQLPPRA